MGVNRGNGAGDPSVRPAGSPCDPPNPDDPFCDADFEGLEEPPRRFEIRDESGKLRASLVRTAGKEMWFERPDGRSGLGGVKAADLPLYGADRLRRVPLDAAVVVTEGPKDCEAVWRARLPAVGTVTGAASTPSAASLEALRDRIIVLWPDNDGAGYEHMQRLAEALAGIAHEIRWLQIPGLPPKGGAADVPVEDIARLVTTYACAWARTRVGGDGTPSRESGTPPRESRESPSLSRKTPTYARACAHEVSRKRYSRGELAEMRKTVRHPFSAPSDRELRDLVNALERIQGRLVRQGQLGYLISCFRVHGPATAELLMQLYRERRSVDNLLLALELATPARLRRGAGVPDPLGRPEDPAL